MFTKIFHPYIYTSCLYCRNKWRWKLFIYPWEDTLGINPPLFVSDSPWSYDHRIYLYITLMCWFQKCDWACKKQDIWVHKICLLFQTFYANMLHILSMNLSTLIKHLIGYIMQATEAKCSVTCFVMRCSLSPFHRPGRK